MMIPKGRGIPHELKVGKSGYNDRDDVMRNKAHRAMDGDLKQVSKPYSPESASSPGNSKLIQGYAKGGHVKKGHRIPTDMHIPTQPKSCMPKKTPVTRVKRHGGVMQGDHGPNHGGPGHEVAVQGSKGPHLKHGGMPRHKRHHEHMLHESLGGSIKKGLSKVGKGLKTAAKVVKPYAKAAYNASKPILREVAKKGIDYGSKALGAAATGAATVAGGPAAGVAAGYLASKASKKLGNYATKKAGLKRGGEHHEHHHMAHKGFGGMLKGAAKAGMAAAKPHLKEAAKQGVKHLSERATEKMNGMRHGGHYGIGGMLKSAGKTALKSAAKQGIEHMASKAATMRHGGDMHHHLGIGGMLKSAGKTALKAAAKEGVQHLANKASTMRHGGVKKKLMAGI